MSAHYCTPWCGCAPQPARWRIVAPGFYQYGTPSFTDVPKGRRPTDFNQRAPTAPCKRCGRQGVGKCGCRGGR